MIFAIGLCFKKEKTWHWIIFSVMTIGFLLLVVPTIYI
jgi:hypothetical protein